MLACPLHRGLAFSDYSFTRSALWDRIGAIMGRHMKGMVLHETRKEDVTLRVA